MKHISSPRPEWGPAASSGIKKESGIQMTELSSEEVELKMDDQDL